MLASIYLQVLLLTSIFSIYTYAQDNTRFSRVNQGANGPRNFIIGLGAGNFLDFVRDRIENNRRSRQDNEDDEDDKPQERRFTLPHFRNRIRGPNRPTPRLTFTTSKPKPLNPDIGEGSVFTEVDLREAQLAIQQLIRSDRENIPNWIQLSFHDCFGDEGCNGCLDLTHPGNRGLINTFNGAKNLHKNIAPTLSFADFVALLGTEAAKMAADGGLDLPFFVGRETCKSTPSDQGLPSGSETSTLSFLSGQFGLSLREAIALIGAHSCGRARRENSGYNGTWDHTEFELDNNFYKALMVDDWEAVKVNNPQARSHQWSEGRFLMLHADMAIRKSFTVNLNDFDEPSCKTMNECSDNFNNIRHIRDFIDDERAFHNEFSRAFHKMIGKTAPAVSLKRLEFI